MTFVQPVIRRTSMVAAMGSDDHRRTEETSSRWRIDMSTRISTYSLADVQASLASEHERHATGPTFPCPLCFRPHLAGSFGPQLRLVEPDAGTPVIASRLPAAA
jgi:hypothetical protein